MTGQPKGLDLCSCAGGASMGFHNAGYDMYGSDIAPQKNYPFAFHQGDAIAVLTALNLGLSVAFTHKDGRVEHLFKHDFAFIHISPPCQRFTQMAACRPGLADTYPDLVGPARELLDQIGLPYIIENVPGSPVRPDVTLCGHMFGLALYRHRIFESNVPLTQPDHVPHTLPASKAGHWRPGTIMSVSGHVSPIAMAREVMGIDWTTRHELAESIPPAYTEELGRQMLAHIEKAVP